MDCNCNNNNTNVIPHIYGNVLSLAIPLTLRTIEVVDGEVEATDTDFIPSSDHPVKVIFSRGTETIPLEATMRDGNIACVEDYGTIPIGVYDITVKCKDDQGRPYRFHQKETLAVFNATSEAGITSPIEYEVKTWYLNAAIYLALKGEGGGGTVTAVKMNNDEPISPDGDGVVNLGTVLTRHQDISGKVDKEQGKSLMSDTEHVKLASLPTADALTAALNRIQAAIDALVGEDDVTQAIDTFNEVIAFLSGVTNNETLIAKLQELQNAINAKQDAISDIATIRIGAGKGATSVQSISIHGGSASLPNNNGNVDLSLSSADVVTPLVTVSSTGDVTQALDADKFYKFGDVDSLSLTLTTPRTYANGIIPMVIYAGKFTASANWGGTKLSIPATVTEAANNDDVEAGKTYEFSIMDNIIIVKEV